MKVMGSVKWFKKFLKKWGCQLRGQEVTSTQRRLILSTEHWILSCPIVSHKPPAVWMPKTILNLRVPNKGDCRGCPPENGPPTSRLLSLSTKLVIEDDMLVCSNGKLSLPFCSITRGRTNWRGQLCFKSEAEICVWRLETNCRWLRWVSAWDTDQLATIWCWVYLSRVFSLLMRTAKLM